MILAISRGLVHKVHPSNRFVHSLDCDPDQYISNSEVFDMEIQDITVPWCKICLTKLEH